MTGGNVNIANSLVVGEDGQRSINPITANTKAFAIRNNGSVFANNTDATGAILNLR